MYRAIFKLLLQRLDAERAHDLGLFLLRLVSALGPVRTLLRRLTAPPDPRLEVRALGHVFPSPLGVAAGVDKDGRSFRGLWALGFGYVEVGTITAHEQKGAEGTRIHRLPRDRAVVNRMGFPNPGAAVAASRLRPRDSEVLVGANIGKSRDSSPPEIGEDYRACVRELASAADYLVLNVSSPNTPGLRDLQAADLLRPLVRDVRQELQALDVAVPVLLKIAPDLNDRAVDSVADLALELELDGIVAVNTTTARTGLVHSPAEEAALLPGGGVSGAPLKRRAVDVLRQLRARVGTELVLVSVGGIETAEDVWERILAGATLVQAYTGFVYGGPAWPRELNRQLARRVAASGARSLDELIGADARARSGPSEPAPPVSRQSPRTAT